MKKNGKIAGIVATMLLALGATAEGGTVKGGTVKDRAVKDRAVKGGETASTAVFHAQGWPLTVRYPADLTVSRTFKKNYFTEGAWRMSYAAGPGAGEPIVAFSLPDRHARDEGGDSDAQLELTIGASRDEATIASCLTYGMNSGNNVQQRMRPIGGIMFTEVPDNSDGGMSHSIETQDFRAVDHGICWAIDLVTFVGGTSNHRPEYTPAEVAHLKSVLDGISFE